MNVNFYSKDDSDAFSKALSNSQSVVDWLSTKMIGYDYEGYLCTLNIARDQYSNSVEDDLLPSFNWSVTKQKIVDTYHYIAPNTDVERVINGGLIYRGTREVSDLYSKSDYDTTTEHYYTSHT